ncbi:uncharacterized protein KY384_004921 [Bacidia gigantensis]|uniref:uncharacterized protein n=1 Tax=Bacidia gigantensis TaxID=2732470 RepID=UPI001D057128|nr:uncharacterized protein KY384_004921 [Bacidia gigantensis]KAG8530419.1 hypothetical protein KY384_004921 [Bacidia gigantensis]
MSLTGTRPYVCFTCRKTALYFLRRSPTRRLTTTSVPSLPPPKAFAPLSSRRLILLNGQDASKYLQGLISANVTFARQEAQQGFYTAFLNAQGRVLHDVFVRPISSLASWRGGPSSVNDGGYLVEVDAKEVDTLYKHLKRYKLRAKIGLRIIDEDDLKPWAVWGHVLRESNDLTLLDRRLPNLFMGYRTYQPDNSRPNIEADQVPFESYELRRMLNGVPEGQTEIPKGTALPQESNIDYMGGIDFRKGCYVGQELTIRTHHTGVVRKRILPVQLYSVSDGAPGDLLYKHETSVDLPPSGTNISRADKKGRNAGKFLGGIGNIGLALCRLEIMTDTTLTGEGSQWDAKDDFKITRDSGDGDVGREIRVKAFVPRWHEERAEAQRVQRPNG